MDRDIGKALRLLLASDLEGVSNEDLNRLLLTAIRKNKFEGFNLIEISETTRILKNQREKLKSKLRQLNIADPKSKIGKIVASESALSDKLFYFLKIDEILPDNSLTIKYKYCISYNSQGIEVNQIPYDSQENIDAYYIRSATHSEIDLLINHFPELKKDDFAL